VRYPLEVFRTKGLGWGVRTQKNVTIPEGKIVCMYSGEYQREEDVKVLEQLYKDEDKVSNWGGGSGRDHGRLPACDAASLRVALGRLPRQAFG
jgi:hypothetical protein